MDREVVPTVKNIYATSGSNVWGEGGERKVRTKSVRTCNRIWNRKTTCITVKDLLAPLLYSKLSQTVRSKATLVARIRWAVQECIDLPWHTIWARDQVSTPLPAFYTVRRDFLTWIIPLPLSLLFVYISRIDQGRNHLDDERYDIRRITFLSSWLLREKHRFLHSSSGNQVSNFG